MENLTEVEEVDTPESLGINAKDFMETKFLQYKELIDFYKDKPENHGEPYLVEVKDYPPVIARIISHYSKCHWIINLYGSSTVGMMRIQIQPFDLRRM